MTIKVHSEDDIRLKYIGTLKAFSVYRSENNTSTLIDFVAYITPKGEWFALERVYTIINPRTNFLQWASVINNPTVTTPAAAYAARTSLVYEDYDKVFTT